MSVQIRVLLANQPLYVGEGCLPEWLRTKKGLYALDTFNNNLCVFCCLVVHKGAHIKNNLRITSNWPKNATYEIPNAKVESQHILLIARYFYREIVVYEVGRGVRAYLRCGGILPQKRKKKRSNINQ